MNKTQTYMALGLIVLAPSVKAAEGIHVRWACYPNLACNQHVGVYGLDQDRADASNRSAPGSVADAAGGAPGGPGGASGGAGPSGPGNSVGDGPNSGGNPGAGRSDRPGRGENCVGRNR